MKRWILYLASIFLHNLGINRLVNYLTGPGLSILMFHRLRDTYDILPLSTHAQTYRKMSSAIQKRGKLVELSQGIENVKNGIAGHFYAITFDDGYEDNKAIPQLGNRGEVVYLATGLVGKRMMWIYRLANAIESLSQETLTLDNFEWGEWPCNSIEDKTALIYFLNKKLKSCHPQEIEKRVDHIVEMCSHGNQIASERMLNWEEVEKLSKSGVVMGGHTVNHAILTSISKEECDEEISGCRQDITRRLGSTPDHFAYPNGTTDDFNDEVVSSVKNAGFTDAVTTVEGINRQGLDPWRLKRFNIHEERITNPFGRFSYARFCSETSGLLPYLKDLLGRT